MANPENDSANIKETDIVFDCPHCGKSLAIDYRGAGLSIPCSDCGKEVVVPIPEGMELTDIDSTQEEQEVRILNLRKSLSNAEQRIEQLEKRIDDLVSGQEDFEELRLADKARFDTVAAAVSSIRASLDDVGGALARIDETVKGNN